MAENKKYGRVWIPSEEFWDLAIPMPEDVTEIKDPQHLYWHLEGWLEELLLQSSEAEEDAHNLVSELQKLGMCSPELSWRKLAEGDPQALQILVEADNAFLVHLWDRMDLNGRKWPSPTEKNEEALKYLMTEVSLPIWHEALGLPYEPEW